MKSIKSISFLIILLLSLSLTVSPVSSDIPAYVVREVGELGTGEGQFNGPYDIIKIGNQYFVSDFENDRIQVFDDAWNYVSQFNDNGGLDGPMGMEYNGSHLFVVEAIDDEVSIFDINGNFVTSFGQTGSGDGQFIAPRGIEIGDGIIFVGDTNDRVQKFDENTLVYTDTIADDFTVDFSASPDGMLYLDGFLYVVASGNGSVNIYNAVDGTPHGTIGSFGRGFDQLWGPSGIEYFNGHFIISSTTTDVIAIFDNQGNFVQRIILPPPTNPIWNGPESMHLEDQELHVPLFFEDKLISLKIVGEPTSFEAHPGANSISLSWQPDNDKGFTPAIDYEIFRNDGSGYEHIVTTNDLFYTDFSVFSNINYTYRIMANSVIGTSENVTSNTLTIPEDSAEIVTIVETTTVTNESTETVIDSTNGGLPLTFPFVSVTLILLGIRIVKSKKQQSN